MTTKLITDYDKDEIMDILAELLRAESGEDEEACDTICYNLDYTDLWLSFEIGNVVVVHLTDKVDDAGFVDRDGQIFATFQLSLPFVRHLVKGEKLI